MIVGYADGIPAPAGADGLSIDVEEIVPSQEQPQLISGSGDDGFLTEEISEALPGEFQLRGPAFGYHGRIVDFSIHLNSYLQTRKIPVTVNPPQTPGIDAAPEMLILPVKIAAEADCAAV